MNLLSAAAAAAKSLQLCPTLCDPIDGNPPGSAIPGIPQARTRVGCHFLLQCVKVNSILSDPMDCSPPVSSVHGIFQARVLEWVAIAFSEFDISQSNFKVLCISFQLRYHTTNFSHCLTKLCGSRGFRIRNPLKIYSC